VNNSVSVCDRQKTLRADTRLLRKITLDLLVRLLPSKAFDLAIHVLPAPEMCRLNETFLRHKGSTDVLAFDYSPPGHRKVLYGEIFVCLDEAFIQARRFGTTWQSELVRYVIHGVLHLTGHDDHHPARRRKMKLEENRLLKQLGRQFDFSELAK
jgi:rRNA maturation RNase YbeY